MVVIADAGRLHNLVTDVQRRIDLPLRYRREPGEVEVLILLEQEMAGARTPCRHHPRQGDIGSDLIGFDVDGVGVQIADEAVRADLDIALVGRCTGSRCL